MMCQKHGKYLTNWLLHVGLDYRAWIHEILNIDGWARRGIDNCRCQWHSCVLAFKLLLYYNLLIFSLIFGTVRHRAKPEHVCARLMILLNKANLNLEMLSGHLFLVGSLTYKRVEYFVAAVLTNSMNANSELLLKPNFKLIDNIR